MSCGEVSDPALSFSLNPVKNVDLKPAKKSPAAKPLVMGMAAEKEEVEAEGLLPSPELIPMRTFDSRRRRRSELVAHEEADFLVKVHCWQEKINRELGTDDRANLGGRRRHNTDDDVPDKPAEEDDGYEDVRFVGGAAVVMRKKKKKRRRPDPGKEAPAQPAGGDPRPQQRPFSCMELGVI